MKDTARVGALATFAVLVSLALQVGGFIAVVWFAVKIARHFGWIA